MNEIFPEVGTGTFVGRVWRPDVAGPALVVVRNGRIIDITSKDSPLFSAGFITIMRGFEFSVRTGPRVLSPAPLS